MKLEGMSSYALYEEARRLMNQGHYEEAATLFEQNIKLRPHFKDLELLGECLMNLGRWADAIVPLAAATTLNQGVRAPSLLAEAYLQQGGLHSAGEMANLALSRDPKNRRALAVKRRLAEKE